MIKVLEVCGIASVLACFAACSSSQPSLAFGDDAASDATQEDAADDASPGMDATPPQHDASDGGVDGTMCGAYGNTCCSGDMCNSGLTCELGLCGILQGDDGGGDATGHDAAGHDSGHPDGSSGDGGHPHDAGDAGAVDCGSTPLLHKEPAGTIYCGFGDGGSLLCPTGEECCLGGYVGGSGFAPQECAPFGGGCSNGGKIDAGGSPAIPIECAQVADCTANGVSKAVACCLQGATAPADLTCSYPKSTGGTAIVCETKGSGTCAKGEVNVCSSQADCPTGTTCTAGKWKIFQVGFCL